MSLRLYAVACEVYALETQADFVSRQSFPQTASREHLDYHAEVRGLSRGVAEKAKGTLRFAASEARETDLTISKGVSCVTQTGLEFVTTEQGVIPAGETWCEVSAEASEEGASGNSPAGSVCYFKLAPVGVTAVTNIAAFTGGCDAEGDDSLRARVLSSYKLLPNGANAAYYVSRVLDVDGVAAVCVLPKERGVGTVDVVFSCEGGVPGGELIESVFGMLQTEREICVDVLVRAPETRSVDVSIYVAVEDEYDFNTVADAVKTAISSLFGGERLGKSVYRAAIAAAAFSVPGVKNCVVSVPSTDVEINADILPLCGKLTVAQA